MQVRESLNIPYIRKNIECCCRGEENCDTCSGKNCLVGFAKIVSNYADLKKLLTIPGGIKLVPINDFKVYEADDLVRTLAVINLECKNCMDNHDENCVVNIMRSSIEIALLGQSVEFSGGALNYIMSLSKINSELGSKVMEKYNELKDEYR